MDSQKTKTPEPANQPTSTRKQVDYDRIDAGWRAGLLNPRQLAAQYTEETGQAVSHAAIIKYFNKKNIPRNLAAKIKAKSDEMVTRALAKVVTDEVTPETIQRDSEIIESGASALTDVRLAQRKDIQRSRKIVMNLLDELEQVTGAENVTLFMELGEMLRKPDHNGQDRLNDLYMKVISLPERSKTMKALADSLRITVDMERQAFGLDSKENSPVDPLTALLHKIASASGQSFKPVINDPEHRIIDVETE